MDMLITIWKAQGSEWDKVVVLEENFPFDKEDHARCNVHSCDCASRKTCGY